MLYFLLLVSLANASFMHRMIFQMRNNVDLDYKKWYSEKLKNRIAYAEFIHLFDFNMDAVLEDD
jgi:hypothetical protein